MACPVIKPDTGVSLEYRHLIQGPDKDIWVKSLANDFGRLAQGVKGRMPTGNSTIFFIHPSEIPSHVPSNNHQYDIARSIRDITTALQRRYLHTPLQPVGDKQFAAIQALENIFCPNIQQLATQAPIHPPM